ncbi:MAG: patatin-like phospholipase family protein [Bacillota bacterium]
MAKYRILTFDGGGVRGALTAVLLKRLSDVFPGLVDSADLFAGTSTGSFIALGLAYGLEPDDLIHLYSESKCRFVFSPRYNNLSRPRYNNENLKELLRSVFSRDLKLKDLKRNVLVPSFRLSGPDNEAWGPVFFNNFPGSPTLDESVIDVALCSSAAPTFFPPYGRYIDGGVIANNPSTAAIAAAIDAKAGRRDLKDVYLLSFGTGSNKYRIDADTKDWGVLEWLLYPCPPLPILTVLTDGVVDADVIHGRQLLGDRYYRLNPVLPKPVPLDRHHQIPYLLKCAEKFDLEPVSDWIAQKWC